MKSVGIKGLHHVTLVTGNYQVNSTFYVELMGLRRVKLSVNQDDVYHRHAFYANPTSTVGSTITFFEWPHLARGHPGLGVPHHIAYRVRSAESLSSWYWWLKSRSVPVAGPFERFYGFSIYVCDPDGAIVEIVTPKDGLNLDYVKELLNRGIEVKHIDDEMKLIAFDHATIIGQDAELVCRFYEKFVGVSTWEKVIDEGGRTYLVALDDERNAYLHYLIPNEADYGLVGRGAIHHVAFAVDDELDQRSIMRRLNSVNLSNSGIVDRFWFRSLYFRDPDGNLLEVATVGPGYAVDEPWDQLGNKLVLPPWIESMRPEIEEALAKLDSDNPFRWPPDFPVLPEDPEVYPPSQTRSNTLNT